MDVTLLGPVAATNRGRFINLGPRKQRLVFAALALQVNRAVSVSRLMDLAWPGGPPRTAHNAIQVCVSRLRTAFLGTGVSGRDVWISRDGEAYTLHAAEHDVDAHRFAARLREVSGLTDPFRRIAVLTEALDEWRGMPLAGTASPEIQQRMCGGLLEARLAAIEDRIAARLSVGQHALVLGELDALVQLNPWRERLVEQRMLALHRGGQPTAALTAYREFRHRLADEFGIDPGPALRQLELAILRNDLEPVGSGARR